MWTPWFLAHQKSAKFVLFLRGNVRTKLLCWGLTCPWAEAHSWTHGDVRMTPSPLVHQRYSTQSQKHNHARPLTSDIASWLSQKCQSTGTGLKLPPAQRSARCAFCFSAKKKKKDQNRKNATKEKQQLVDLVDAEGFLLRRVCLQRLRKATPEALRFSGLKLELRIGNDLEARPGNSHCHVNISC